MRQNGIALVGALALCGSVSALTTACTVTVDAGPGPYSVREEKRFDVTGTPDLVVTTFDGSMEIRSWDRPQVLIEIEKRAADKALADSIQVTAERTGNAITLEVKKPAGVEGVFGFHTSPSARIVASVPRSCNIVARSGDGAITIERVTGKIELNTGDGSVHGVELDGSLRAHTGDGSLRFDNVSGSVDLDSGDGGARLSGKLQGVRLRTGDGSVDVRAEDGSAMNDDWEIRTGDGGLRLELPAGFAASLDAATGDGAVRVRGFGEPTGSGRSEDDNRSLKRPLGSGGKLLRLRSDSGTITVKTL
jgi:hypothetical protein